MNDFRAKLYGCGRLIALSYKVGPDYMALLAPKYKTGLLYFINKVTETL